MKRQAMQTSAPLAGADHEPAVPGLPEDPMDKFRRLFPEIEVVTLGEMEARFRELGYRLGKDPWERCYGTSTTVSCPSNPEAVGFSHPNVSLMLFEADTGRSAFHFESRRDANFKAMQELRGSTVAIVRGAVYHA